MGNRQIRSLSVEIMLEKINELLRKQYITDTDILHFNGEYISTLRDEDLPSATYCRLYSLAIALQRLETSDERKVILEEIRWIL